MKEKKKSSFSSSLGFILTAAGSAVGVGNLWRFPYLAAKDGGGLFIFIYLILILTFGFTLLATDIAIGRKTRKNAFEAFQSLNKKWGFLGKLTFLVPSLIMTYYCVIGGWILKYIISYSSLSSSIAASHNYFYDFIQSFLPPIVYTLIFLAITAFIVYRGVEKGVEKFSTYVMPGLFIIIIFISIYSLTLSYTTADGIVRTGLDGLKVYLIPNFDGLTLKRFIQILLDAMSQLFFSLSVSMGIMITYGSYVPKDINLNKSISLIEICDSVVALLAGMMIIPAVYVFMGSEGMSEGAGLMFVSLPQVFQSMGPIGGFIGLIFFIMVAFAALTSSISIMETLVATISDLFKTSRKKVSLIIAILAGLTSIIICMGYNVFFFKVALPNGTIAQLIDVVDYIANNFLMPFISLLTCIFIGWIIKPKAIIEEMESSGHTFTRKKIYTIMIKYVTPVMMMILFLTSTGIL